MISRIHEQWCPYRLGLLCECDADEVDDEDEIVDRAPEDDDDEWELDDEY